MARKNHITSSQSEVLQRAVDFINGQKPQGVTVKEHSNFKKEMIKALGIKKCAVCGRWNYSDNFPNKKKSICCNCIINNQTRCTVCNESQNIEDMFIDVEREKTLCRNCQSKIVYLNLENGIKRTCLKCKSEFPLTDEYFGWNIRSKNYLRGVCKSCRADQHREYGRKINQLNKY